MSELYTKEILRWTMKIPNQGRLKGPDASASVKSRVCGSAISLDAIFGDDGNIRLFGWDVKACALGQACAAIVGQNITGVSKAEVVAIRKAFEAQTKDGTSVDWQGLFDGRWGGLADLALVHGHTGRYGSVLLPFDALDEVFSQQAQA